MTNPFQYPLTAHTRRHGPRGYSDYESYRAWLRDEFAFRCVYCLTREVWVPGGFHLDHFVPTSQNPSLLTEYDDLLYSCANCNQIKRDLIVPDPTLVLDSGAVKILRDGSLWARSISARTVIGTLRLNRPKLCKYRRMWMQIVAIALKFDPELWRQLLGFPDDLPDLTLSRPSDGNSRPEGIEESYFSRRQRDELPDTY